MIFRLAFAHLAHRPWRSALLFGGFGLGVGVMIVLLSIGEAMMAQARDEKLVGGGDVTVLPEGLDLEVMKTGGIGGLFFSIPNARFVQRQVLASPRLQADVRAVAPQIAEKLLYLRAGTREYAVRGIGEVPSASAAVGALPTFTAGQWRDDTTDAAWMAPSPRAALHQMDHLHYAPSHRSAADRRAWGEWHYFNVLSADGARWAFITLMLVGDVPSGDWGAQILVTLHERGRPARRYAQRIPAAAVRFDTSSANLNVGDAYVRVTDDGGYEVRADAPAEGSGPPVRVALSVTPAARQYFPGASIADGETLSGYAVPGLRASATGTICSGTQCETFASAQAYHDHNWGLWRNVNWEWGAARAGAYTFLYGRVQSTDPTAASAPIFFYLVDSLGFRALFRPQRIAYEDGRTITVDGQRVQVPSRATMTDVRGRDTLRLTLDIEDATGTDTRRGLVERGETEPASRLTRPYFIQLSGRATLSGRVGGQAIGGTGAGFFETYR